MDFLDRIVLNPDEVKKIKDYRYPAEWTARCLRSKQASIYIAQNLIEVSRQSRQPYSCCSEGTIVFRRLDGWNITEDDVTALLCIERGQENRVKSRTENEVTIYWLCDSSG